MAPPAFRPEGVWTALVTPFEKNGKLDSAAFKRLVDFQIAQGITGIVPVGTTGESPTLSWEEHNRSIDEAVAFAQGRVGVLAGTGSNCTDEAIDATRHAREAGASGALLVDCYYNGPSSLELRTQYYEQVAEWVPHLPLVPYIIPGRCGTALSAEDMALLHRGNPQVFVAVKEATGDLNRMRLERTLSGESLAILSGDDDLTLGLMEDPGIRAAGTISVMGNLVPGPLSRMVKSWRSGDLAAARALGAQLAPLFKLVTFKVPGQRRLPDGRVLNVEDRFRNPLPVKTMMAGLGMPVGACRRPLGRMSVAGVAACRQALKNLEREHPEFLAPIADTFCVNVGQRLADDAVWAGLSWDQ